MFQTGDKSSLFARNSPARYEKFIERMGTDQLTPYDTDQLIPR
jgi:hypothetical protein